MNNAIFVTASIACGKSSFIKIAKELGFDTISADEISHNMLKLYTNEIVQMFENYNILKNKEIDRKLLGKIIFSINNAKTKLENFLHPKIKEEILNQAKILDKLNKIFFIELPLYFESDNYKNLGKSLVIYSNKDLCIKRLMIRDNLDEVEALKRINSQIDIEYKKAQADFVIENIGSYEEFLKNSKKFLKDLKDKNEIL